MNRNAAATEIKDASKRCAGNMCWSSEWSFVEDAEVALQKPVRSPIAKKQTAGSQANTNPVSS